MPFNLSDLSLLNAFVLLAVEQTSPPAMAIVGLMLASYLAGSIPFGLVIGKAVKGIDLREHGSGNIGATNAGRVLGKKWGIICLVLDALKGMMPVILFPELLLGANAVGLEQSRVLAGVSTVVGHMFSCWLGFRGGKGVATSLGVAGVLCPWALCAAVAAFVISMAIWRIVSLSSISSAVLFGIVQLVILSPDPFKADSFAKASFAIAVPLLIVIQHRSNIRRLLTGEEPRFEFKRTERPRQPENP